MGRQGAREGGGEAGLRSLSYQQTAPGEFEIKTPAHQERAESIFLRLLVRTWEGSGRYCVPGSEVS